MSFTQAMLQSLEDYGPQTACELCESVGTTHARSGRLIAYMTKETPRHKKRVYVTDYVFDADDGARRYPRALYALGSNPDAKKPKSSSAANTRRWRDRNRFKVNSVWALGTKIKERERRAVC